MAARLTPDQKVGRSNRSGLIFIYSHGYRTPAWACETAAGSAGTGCLVELPLGAPGFFENIVENATGDAQGLRDLRKVSASCGQ